VRNISGFDVISTTGKVENGRVVEYHADVKFAFPVNT
jgi:flavin-binding protein dodecin